MITLYKNHSERIGTWRIWNEENTIYYDYAILENSGSRILNKEEVQTNQSGRSMEEQVQLRINSMISTHLDRGYKKTREEAQTSKTNQLGLLRPMLAKQLKQVKYFNKENAYLQFKLDGHRCLITRQGNEIVAYSRQGKLIKTINHITKSLVNMPDGYTLDGDLYSHGQSLQTLSSWIKREQLNSEKLLFVAYDLISDASFKYRYMELKDILFNHTNAIPLPTYRYKDEDHMYQLFGEARAKGYEGLMIRTSDHGYEDGVRSSSLIKVKSFMDEEFQVIDVIPAKD